MESFVASDIARLVYGYLEEHNCDQAAQIFLDCSKYLEECREASKKGRRFHTKIAGRTLTELLDLFSEIVYQLSCFFAESPAKDQTIVTPVQVLSKLACLVGYSEAVISKRLFDPTPVISSNISLLDGVDPVKTVDGYTQTSPTNHQISSAEKRKSLQPQSSPRDHRLTQEDLFDLNVLDTLINNTVLHEKIAANINKAKEKDVALGEGSEIVKAALSNTEADPIFDQVIKDIVASAPAENAESSTPDDTEAENAEEGEKKGGNSKTDEEKRLEAENEAVKGILSSGKEVRRLSAEGAESETPKPPNDAVAVASSSAGGQCAQNAPTPNIVNQLNPGVELPPIIIQVIPTLNESNSGTSQSSFLNFHGLMQKGGKNESDNSDERDELSRYRPILPKPAIPFAEDEEEPQPPTLFISPVKVPGNRRGVKMRGGKRRRGSKRKLKALHPALERINQDNYHIDLAVPPGITLRSLRPRRGRPPKLPHLTREVIHSNLLKRAHIRYEEVCCQEKSVVSLNNAEKDSAEDINLSQNVDIHVETKDITETIKEILNDPDISDTDVTPEKKGSKSTSEKTNILDLSNSSNKENDESNDSSDLEETRLVIEEPEEKNVENLPFNKVKGYTEEGNNTTEEMVHTLNRKIDGNSNITDNQTQITSPKPTMNFEPNRLDSSQETKTNITSKSNDKRKSLKEGKSNQKNLEETTSKSKTPRTLTRGIPLRKGLSLSSPRRGSHIRALDFKTPDKSSSPRKAATSPKAVSQVNLTKLRSLRRVSLFKTPQKKKSNSSWDADLRAFCPVSPDVIEQTKIPRKQIRRKNPRKMTKPRRTIPLPRKRAVALSKASVEAEQTVLATIQEDNEESNDIVSKIFKETNPVSNEIHSSDFPRPKVPEKCPELLQKTPAKPLLVESTNHNLTPSQLMTPVTSILNEHSKLLAANQLLTPSFAATPDYVKSDPTNNKRDDRTPSPEPPCEVQSCSDVSMNETTDPGKNSDVLNKSDELETDKLKDAESKSMNSSGEIMETHSPTPRKTDPRKHKQSSLSKFPKVCLAEPKKHLAKETTKENLIEQCLKLAKNELFSTPGSKKKKKIPKSKNKLKKPLETPDSPNALDNSIKLPSFDELMERYNKMNSKLSSSSDENEPEVKQAVDKECVSKHFDVPLTDSSSSSSSDDELFLSKITSSTKIQVESRKEKKKMPEPKSQKLKLKQSKKSKVEIISKTRSPEKKPASAKQNLRVSSVLDESSDSSEEPSPEKETLSKNTSNQSLNTSENQLTAAKESSKSENKNISPKKSPLPDQKSSKSNQLEQNKIKSDSPGHKYLKHQDSCEQDAYMKEQQKLELKVQEEIISPSPASPEKENSKSFEPSCWSIQAPSPASPEPEAYKPFIPPDKSKRLSETIFLESPASPEQVNPIVDSTPKDSIKKSSKMYSESKKDDRKKDEIKYSDDRYHYHEWSREMINRFEERRYAEGRRHDFDKNRRNRNSYGRKHFERSSRGRYFRKDGPGFYGQFNRFPYSKYSPSRRSPPRYRSPERHSPERIDSSPKKSAHRRFSPRRSPQRHSSPTSPHKRCSSPRNISPIYKSNHSRNTDLKDHKSKTSSSHEKVTDVYNDSSKGFTPGSARTIPVNPRDSAADPRLFDPRLSDPRKSARSSIYKNLSVPQQLSSYDETVNNNKRKINSVEKEDGEISDSDMSSSQTFYMKKQKIDLQSSNSCDINSSYTSVDQVTSEKGKSLLEKVGVDRFLSIVHGSP